MEDLFESYLSNTVSEFNFDWRGVKRANHPLIFKHYNKMVDGINK